MKAPLTVILAGGEGSRIGGDKPSRLLGGERLIDRAVRAARFWSDDLRLAVRHRDQVPGVDLPLLIDDGDEPGPIAGLGSALKAARHAGREFVLTIPCDVPFLPADLGDRLQAAIGARLAAIAASGTRRHPTCALWRVEALDRISAYSRSGRRSLMGFAEAVGFVCVDWKGDFFFNVNSESDLAEAERRLLL